MQNVEELLAWMQRLADREDGDMPLADMIAHMTLMDILERDDGDAVQDCVHLLTLHASKGLEFPHVFIAGMEEELLPHRSSIEAGDIEEERRLAYVGITRAQRSLVLSLCARRKRQGEMVSCEPSRFLAELPQEELIWEGVGTQADPEQRKERGQAHLANLRGMLGET